MAHLNPVPLAEVKDDDIRERFEHYRNTRGFTPNSIMTMVRRPNIVRAFMALNQAVLYEGTVPEETKMLVSLACSYAAGCLYCQSHMTNLASIYKASDEKIAALWDFENSTLFNDAERAAIRLALKAGAVPNEASAGRLRRTQEALHRRADRRDRGQHRAVRLPQPLERHHGHHAGAAGHPSGRTRDWPGRVDGGQAWLRRFASPGFSLLHRLTMRDLPTGLAIGLGMLLSGAGALGAPCAQPDHISRVDGGTECLLIKTFRHDEGTPSTLFVLLHGNHSSGSPAVSQVPVAESLARSGPDGTVAVALIRPGYNDAEGHFSSGNAAGRNDNFYAGNIDVVADAIGRLKAFHRPRRLVLVGHSGGAAMAGVMLGRHPGLADAAVVVACPCNVPAWRAMRGRRDVWSSESAELYVDRVAATARVVVLVGDADDVTPSSLSKSYADNWPRGASRMNC